MILDKHMADSKKEKIAVKNKEKGLVAIETTVSKTVRGVYQKEKLEKRLATVDEKLLKAEDTLNHLLDEKKVLEDLINKVDTALA